jgi:hypothetical protein
MPPKTNYTKKIKPVKKEDLIFNVVYYINGQAYINL